MIEMYTDGACSGNPGPGGYGLVILKDNNIIKYKKFEFCDNTTNNREEMKAIIEAFKLADFCFPDEDIFIYSDSAYCVNMIKDWIWNWSKNGWKNSKKKEVENIDLVKKIYNYINKEFYHCQVVKISGHSGKIGNEIADALATNNSKKYLKLIEDNNLIENIVEPFYKTEKFDFL